MSTFSRVLRIPAAPEIIVKFGVTSGNNLGFWFVSALADL